MAYRSPAIFLQKEDYVVIEQSMLEFDVDSPNAAIAVTPESQAEWLHSESDYSLVRQLGALYWQPNSVGESLSRPPDAFLLTLWSALPLGDSIRGFYDELGISTPPILPIQANAKLAKRHNETIQRQPQSRTRQERQQIREIREKLADCRHLCIVEEFAMTGQVGLYAGRLALAAGAEQVSVIRGRWWLERDEEDTSYNVSRATSQHKPFLYEIGHLAAEKARSLFIVQNTNKG